MSCQERSGFLFSHDCDQPGIFPCEGCGKTVCALHQRFANGRSLCISCFGATPVEPTQTGAAVAPAAVGTAAMPPSQPNVDGGMGSSRTDDPYFYADTHRHSGWSDADRSVFRSHTPTSSPSDFDSGSNVDAS
jgi:hypothetical protein